MFVALTSGVAVFLHWISAFDPFLATVGGGLGSWFWWWRWGTGFRSAVWRGPRALAPLLLLALLAGLLFRGEPVRFVVGGHDSGNYVNMGAFLIEAPSATHLLPAVENLPPGAARADYLDDIARGIWERGVDNRYEGSFVPGLYVADAEKGELVFQFFHLLPLWIAIFGRFAGIDNGVWANTVFGLLTIVNFGLIAHRLTGSRWAAFLAALLLAVNPLHAYFSRVPVSEVLTVFCSSSALLSFLWALDARERAARRAVPLLVLAVSYFGLLCMTRISGFMYLPFVAAALVFAAALPLSPGLRRFVFAAGLGAIAIYALSVVYGWSTSFPYCADQYHKCFAPFLGVRWGAPLTVLVGALLLLTGLLIAMGARDGVVQRMLRGVFTRLSPLILGLFIFFALIHALRIYLLATGDHYADHSLAGIRFQLFGQGWSSATHSSLLYLVLYTGGFPLALFLWMVGSRWNEGVTKRFLLLFLVGFVGFVLVLQWVLPYQYYWGRYLLSESVPYLLLAVVVLAWKEGGGFGRVRGCLLWAGVGIGVSMSATQWRFTEANRFLHELRGVIAPVDSSDLLLLRTSSPGYTALHSPLSYYFKRRVVPFSSYPELDVLLTPRFVGEHRDIWLLEAPRVQPPESFVPWDRATLHRGTPDRTAVLPLREVVHRTPVALYRWMPENTTSRELWGSAAARVRNRAEGIHADGIWTDGEASIEFGFEGSADDVEALAVELYGWINPRAGYARWEIDARLNGQALPLLERHRTRLRFAVPADLLRQGKNRLTLISGAFVPADLGPSTDGRRLGLDLKSVRLE